MKIMLKLPGGRALEYDASTDMLCHLSVQESAGSPVGAVGLSLRDGRRVILFVNEVTNLVVVDVLESDEDSGTEIFRRHL